MKTNKGFTLIEMLIAMVITLVLVGIVMVVYIVQANEVTESMKYAHAQRVSDLFHEEFSRDIRFANRILDNGEIFATVKNAFPDGSTTSVLLTYNKNGIVENQYSLLGDTVLLNGLPFITGQGAMTIDSDSSFFILSTFRDKVLVALKISSSSSDDAVVLAQRQGVYTCRN